MHRLPNNEPEGTGPESVGFGQRDRTYAVGRNNGQFGLSLPTGRLNTLNYFDPQRQQSNLAGPRGFERINSLQQQVTGPFETINWPDAYSRQVRQMIDHANLPAEELITFPAQPPRFTHRGNARFRGRVRSDGRINLGSLY